MKKIVFLMCYLITPILHASLFLPSSELIELIQSCGGLKSAVATLQTTRDIKQAELAACKEKMVKENYFSALHTKQECKNIKKECRKINNLLVRIYECFLLDKIEWPQLGVNSKNIDG